MRSRAPRRGLLLAVLAAVLVGAVPAGASPARVMSVRGTQGRSVVILPTFEIELTVASISAKTTGSYIGFYLVPLDRRGPSWGALAARHLAFSGDEFGVQMLGARGKGHLSGRYRLYLFGDGSGSISLPLSGSGRSVTLAPKPNGAPHSFEATEDYLSGPIDGTSVSRRVPQYSRALVATEALVESSEPLYRDLWVCVSHGDTSCGDTDNDSVQSTGSNPFETETRAGFARELVPSDEYTRIELESLVGASTLRTTHLVLSLG